MGLRDYLISFDDSADDDLRYIVLEECDTFSVYTVVDTSDNVVVEYCGTEWWRADRSASKMNAEIEWRMSDG